jgi:hypothetical protein
MTRGRVYATANRAAVGRLTPVPADLSCTCRLLQRDCPFAVDKARDISGIRVSKFASDFVRRHSFACLTKIPLRRPSGWLTRRDIGGGGGTVVPSLSRWAGLCLHPAPVIHDDHAQERSVLFGLPRRPFPSRKAATSKHRILVSAPPLPDQPIYESLQGRRSWPSSTPRRCHISRCRLTQGSPNEPRYHFALAGKGDH